MFALLSSTLSLASRADDDDGGGIAHHRPAWCRVRRVGRVFSSQSCSLLPPPPSTCFPSVPPASRARDDGGGCSPTPARAACGVWCVVRACRSRLFLWRYAALSLTGQRLVPLDARRADGLHLRHLQGRLVGRRIAPQWAVPRVASRGCHVSRRRRDIHAPGIDTAVSRDVSHMGVVFVTALAPRRRRRRRRRRILMMILWVRVIGCFQSTSARRDALGSTARRARRLLCVLLLLCLRLSPLSRTRAHAQGRRRRRGSLAVTRRQSLVPLVAPTHARSHAASAAAAAAADSSGNPRPRAPHPRPPPRPDDLPSLTVPPLTLPTTDPPRRARRRWPRRRPTSSTTSPTRST